MPSKNRKVAYDLSRLKPAEIAKFRNLAIANVINPLGSDVSVESHDRHYSNHSKDAANSFLLSTDAVSLPSEIFKGIDGVKEISTEDFIKRLR
ncbi:MAG: hypothetical protein COB16_17460 [Rhodobacteraceae bacterium]|nr:MAG: hypothetical protein COB16_17460 [Paracoccaceae bacterium]